MSRAFDLLPDRRDTGSVKWDVKENELPMWVADMDYKAAPAIIKALKSRVDSGFFGYFDLPDEWYEAYISFLKERHGIAVPKKALVFVTGIVPAISSAVRKLTTPGENVVIMTPVYNIFFNSILNNGRNVIEVPLLHNGSDWDVDWKAFEKAVKDRQTTLFILCDPHNPTGRIWTKDELNKIGELCKKHNVKVVSDEIHCDVITPGKEYVPFASVSDVCREISVSCVSPTKAFNIAGIQTAAVYSFNEDLRHKMWRQINTDECGEPNAFAVNAAVAALRDSRGWLEEMNGYVYQNKLFAKEFIENNVPRIKYDVADATYLAWMDISEVEKNSERFCKKLRKETGLFITPGSVYGKGGEGFVRVNLATSRANVEDGLCRLGKFVCRG